MKRDREHAPAEPEAEHAPELTSERAIVCRDCGSEVTHAREAIAVDGKHLHHFVNPAGVAFDIRCFREATGCQPFGETSSFFSWFPGHAWQIALCGSCAAHLGWRFEGTGSSFYGLISERIGEAP